MSTMVPMYGFGGGGGTGAELTVMPGGEHWFHTEEQMRFLDEWIEREEQRT